MHQGVVTAGNFAELLRGIAQKRRQGALEITLGESSLKIYFVSGRIVEALEGAKSPLEEIVELVKAASLVPDDFELGSEESYEDLFQSFSNHPGIELSKELFKRTVKHRILEKLYTFDPRLGALFTFRIEMVGSDKEFSPAISVGQLLLDLVALDTEKAEFERSFPPGSWVQRSGGAPENLSDEEECLYDLATAPIPLDALQRRSLLSSFQFRETLESLARRDLLVGMPEPDESDGEREPDEDEAIDHSSAVDGGDEEVDDEEEDDDVLPWRVRLQALSMELTTVGWLPHLLVTCFIILALLSPLVFWSDLLEQYKQG